MALLFLGIVVVVLIIYMISVPTNEPGMAPVSGPRFKQWIANFLIQLGTTVKKRNAIQSDEELDRRIPDLVTPPNPKYNDSFVFTGTETDKGDDGCLFIGRLGFRGEGYTEIWLMLLGGKITKNFGRLAINSRIATTESKNLIQANGLSFECIVPGKKWKVQYQGLLRSELKGDVQVCINLTWDVCGAMYHSAKHLSPSNVAIAMSEMPWSRNYFEAFKTEHQVRIEQLGTLTGTIDIATESNPIHMRGIRDHSWGRRDWGILHRYIWSLITFNSPLTFNGKSFDSMSFMIARYGTLFKCLVGGWMASDKVVIPVVASTHLDQIADDGDIPKEYVLHFRPENGPIISMFVQHNGSQSWFMEVEQGGPPFEACDHNCKFQLRVGKSTLQEWKTQTKTDGITTGYGLIEFGYSHKTTNRSNFKQRSFY